MKAIYETPVLNEEVMVNKDVMAASVINLETEDKDNTYVTNFSIFNPFA